MSEDEKELARQKAIRRANRVQKRKSLRKKEKPKLPERKLTDILRTESQSSTGSNRFSGRFRGLSQARPASRSAASSSEVIINVNEDAFKRFSMARSKRLSTNKRSSASSSVDLNNSYSSVSTVEDGMNSRKYLEDLSPTSTVSLKSEDSVQRRKSLSKKITFDLTEESKE